MDPAAPPRRTNLPAELSSFVGRRKELARVRAAVAGHPLVTLTGPGGVGKTRLAVRSAADLAADFADGAWVVELAPVLDPALVAETVAVALGLRDRAGASALEGLLAYLRERAVLLVLDNSEHLQDAVAALVRELLGHCPSLKIMATSRHALGVDVEFLVPVPPLSVPAADRGSGSPEGLLHYDSVRLFVDRATASWPSFEVTHTNEQPLAELVRRLDGVPLAIELAAVRVRSLSVQQILDRLADRFALLTRGDRAALPRQQTLRALIDWSHDLLGAEEQTLWRRATVFAGSFDHDDLEAVVCDATLPAERLVELTGRLVAKSVLVRETSDVGPRLHMLESLKEYGFAKLVEAGDALQVERRHLDHYHAQARAAAADMFGPRGVLWFRRLGAAHDDLRAALERCVVDAERLESGCAMMGALQHHWVMTGRFTEGRYWLDRLLGRHPDPGISRTAALVVSGRLAVLQGDVTRGRPLLEEALADATALGSATWRAHALHGLAITALFWEEPIRARTLLEEALVLHRDGDDPLGVPLALVQLATAHATLGETERAMEYAEECITLSRAHGEQWCAGLARWTEALIVWRQGRPSRARAYAREVLRLKEPFGDRLGMAMSMEMIAWALSLEGRSGEAATLLGAVESALSSIGGALFRHLRDDHQRCVDRTRAALGEAEYRRAVDTGATLSFDDAVALALGRTRGSGRGVPAPRPGTQRTTAAGLDRVRLTRRESEVARLVAEGLTNREIADRLVMSQRTAEGHVQRILTKLNVTSRRQVASWLAENAG